MDAGTVIFSDPVNGIVTITIELNDGWRFLDDDENLKIQGYDAPPMGNPSPGKFDYKFYAVGDDPFSVDVPVDCSKRHVLLRRARGRRVELRLQR